MNTYLRTSPLPVAVPPVREHGSSALDRVVDAWPAPVAAARVLDRWGMPVDSSVTPAAWPAPDPVMRFDLPAPTLVRKVASADGFVPWTDLVEPRYEVTPPDLQSASAAALTAAPPVVAPAANWAAPMPAAAPASPASQAEPTRNRFSTRAKLGIAAATGAVVAGAATLAAIF